MFDTRHGSCVYPVARFGLKDAHARRQALGSCIDRGRLVARVVRVLLKRFSHLHAGWPFKMGLLLEDPSCTSEDDEEAGAKE
eukprot:3573565-Pyramimonas_sp.AAC.1